MLFQFDFLDLGDDKKRHDDSFTGTYEEQIHLNHAQRTVQNDSVQHKIKGKFLNDQFL